MAATQLGQDLMVGVGTTMGSYIVSSIETGGKEVKSEDVFDEDGVLKTRIIMQRMEKISLQLIPLTGATPTTDFPTGSICTIAPLSGFYIDNCQLSRTEGAARVTVEATNIGVTT